MATSIFVLAGCAATDPGLTQTGSPKFSGPHAAEYTDVWQMSTDPFVRQVILDEKITDQE